MRVTSRRLWTRVLNIEDHPHVSEIMTEELYRGTIRSLEVLIYSAQPSVYASLSDKRNITTITSA